MKRYLQSFSYATVFIFFTALATAGPTQLFSLSVAAPKEPLKAGTELHLLVTVRNTSKRAISFIIAPGPIPEDELEYEINVRDADGRSAPPSAYLRNKDKRVPMSYGSRLARTLEPGESFVEQVTVTTFFDLSRPGKYTISVSRAIPPRQNLGKGSVESDPVTVIVAP